MSTNVIPLKPLPQHRHHLDPALEHIATAAHFAVIVREGFITAEFQAQAEAYLKFGTPVVRYQGGVRVEETVS